ncbi:hypothetical protein C0Z16_18930 [Paraburkholderia rhynchosiae]|nr:hypothetical protein C0Z16_18930 [Paraburkholderia rhynchosiae]
MERPRPEARPAPPAVESRPVALNVPLDYGWPLGLMKRQHLESLPLDQAYEEAFRTHRARVDTAVHASATQRFGHAHIDDKELRAQLHAWRDGDGGVVENDDVPWRPESESEWESERESDIESEAGSHSVSPKRESEIQSVHSSAAQSAAIPGEAGTSGMRRVRFAPQAEARVIDDERSTLKPEIERFPIHSPQRESVKPKRHAPESPESHALYRQRSVNGAAWDTVMRMKSPRFGPEDKRMTQEMLKQNKLIFSVKREYKVTSEEEPVAVKLVHALDRETQGPSFGGKVKGLMRRLRGKDRLPARIAIPGEDIRYETLQRANNQ